MSSPFTRSLLSVLLAALTSYAHAWTPGAGNESDTSGFTVNTQSRNDVISFWNCVYQKSEEYLGRSNDITGVSTSTCNPGTTSTALRNDILRRLNYYRAMAGLPSDISFTTTSTVYLGGDTPAAAKPPASTTKLAAAQAAALMRLANASTTENPHNPPTSWTCDDSVARNGAYWSNLARNLYGPGAVDSYISEDIGGISNNPNDNIGHRRTLFRLDLQEIASGDTKEGSSTANALYVFGNFISPTPAGVFTSWPNAGYIPYQITPDRWSLTHPDADFSSATITMKDGDNNTVSVTPIGYAGTGLPVSSCVWIPDTSQIPSSATDDATFTVTISGITGPGVASSYTFTTTVIDPDRLLNSTNLTGSTNPPDSGADYFFTPVPYADQYRFLVSALTPSTWVEGAESSAFLVNQTAMLDSELRSTNTKRTGSRALRMAFVSSTETNASVELNRIFIPNTGSKVNFYTRRGVMLSTTVWAIQIRNGNGPWADLKTLTNHTGSTSYPLDSSFVSHSVDIPAEYHGTSSSLRIVYRRDATPPFIMSQHSLVGVFTDDISLVNCDDLSNLGDFTYNTPNLDRVSLDASTAGESLVSGKKYLLSLSVTVGCKNYGFGSALEVTPVSAASLSTYELWFRGSYAIIGDFDDDYDADGIPNGVEHVFDLNPMDSGDGAAALTPTLDGGDLELSHSIISGGTVGAEYSYSLEAGSWNPVTVVNSGGVATASFAVPAEKTECFIRWKAIEP
ncbi:MAG: hypothetical protein H7A51_02835 [Akkermansiaceae bacterium]|nr:hypothetical protein [Akkermansiaceae bacterium]